MTRGQWTLVGLLVVQALLIAVLRNPGSAESTEPGTLVPAFETTDVVKIEVGTRPEEKLILQRDGSSWSITSANGYPAETSKVSELLEAIRDAKTRGAVVTSRKYHDSLEVSEEKARARVRLYKTGSNDPFVDLIIGKTTTGGAHARVAGSEDVFDVRDLSPWQLRPDAATWMQKKLVDIPTDSVQKVAVTNASGSFEIEKRDDEWVVSSPEEAKGRKANKEKVDAIVRAIASLTPTGPAGRIDPSQGLGDDAVTATLTHADASVTVRIGAPVPDKDGQVYVTRDGFGFAATQWETSLNSVKNAKLDELLQ